MAVTTFDLTPDPKVLVALTRTPLQPLDALCELIDNAIDGFQEAVRQGVRIEHPLVAVTLPSRAELREGMGTLVVRDNGPGMTPQETEKAMRAGYSGNNPYDSLGLFGMGFNIASGKLGRQTDLVTCRHGELSATRVSVDLDQIRNSRSYAVPYEVVAPADVFPGGVLHGTQITVARWWPQGDANSGFVDKLVQYGLPTIRRELGRRYATILRRKSIRLLVNGEDCSAFEHCVWAASRFVERRGHGRIPARFEFSVAVGHQRRCASCAAMMEDVGRECPSCGSGVVRTIEERVRGWVGIQRFDDSTSYGIDLIRNGRAIRIGEREAFFEYVDDLKRVTKDYPIDQPFGRIVGEVHLDHVPVDFLKQDFQRSSPEWARAIAFLRGNSSLQPTAEGSDQNDSPIFKLYQGYRRVRTPGRTDLYMGYWDVQEEKPKRVPRSKEQEFYKAFLERQPGYFDDAEWWKLVEQADQPPVEDFLQCPQCTGQNMRDAVVCQLCGTILRGHACINADCQALVADGAASCPVCGSSQEITAAEPWICSICRKRNPPEAQACTACGADKAQKDPFSDEELIQHSVALPALSRRAFSVRLADGTASQPLDVSVYKSTRTLIPFNSNERTSVVTSSSLSSLRIYVDTGHPLFRLFRVPVEEVVANEIASHILAVSPRPRGLAEEKLHTQPNVAYRVLETLLGTPQSQSDAYTQSVEELAQSIRERAREAFRGAYGDLYSAMSDEEKRQLLATLLAANIDPAKLPGLIESGQFVEFVSPATFRRAVEEFPGRTFDGGIWNDTYASLGQHAQDIGEQYQRKLCRRYATLITEVFEHAASPEQDPHLRDRADAALRFLKSGLA